MATQAVLSPPQVLVVDDEPDLRALYELTLLREGYRVDTAASIQEALQCLQDRRFDVLLTDMRLPDGMGTTILRHIRAEQRPERCIVITAHGSAENAVESLKAGAFDYLSKPVDLKQFRSAVASALQSSVPRAGPRRRATDQRCENPSDSALGQAALSRLVGHSSVMQLVRERIIKVARSMAPVLIQGESGTGKELVAKALHANSHRATGPWVAVNCSAIPEALLESEFFGAKKGAYTGSTQDRDGYFQAAKGGTLFLDEIGDLPLAMQSKLLRAIQERSIRAVGSSQEDQVDVRLISATHKNLQDEVQNGRFRQDLFYRINVIDIVLPPLRQRSEDLPDLCDALLARIAAEANTPTPTLNAQALDFLAHQPLAGNVRELENLLHRALALSDSDVLTEMDFLESGATLARPLAGASRDTETPVGMQAPVPVEAEIPADLQAHLDAQERAILVKTLQETGFNRTLAANRLGLSLRQIRYRIARLKIDVPRSNDDGDD